MLERLKGYCKKGLYCVKRLGKPASKERRKGKESLLKRGGKKQLTGTPVLYGVLYINSFLTYVQKNFSEEFLTSSESSTTRSTGITMQNPSRTQEDAEKADRKYS